MSLVNRAIAEISVSNPATWQDLADEARVLEQYYRKTAMVFAQHGFDNIPSTGVFIELSSGQMDEEPLQNLLNQLDQLFTNKASFENISALSSILMMLRLGARAGVLENWEISPNPSANATEAINSGELIQTFVRAAQTMTYANSKERQYRAASTNGSQMEAVKQLQIQTMTSLFETSGNIRDRYKAASIETKPPLRVETLLTIIREENGRMDEPTEAQVRAAFNPAKAFQYE